MNSSFCAEVGVDGDRRLQFALVVEGGAVDGGGGGCDPVRDGLFGSFDDARDAMDDWYREVPAADRQDVGVYIEAAVAAERVTGEFDV